MSGLAVADTSRWEFEVGGLPELRIGYHDGLIVGLLPKPLHADSDDQEMLLCDVLDVDPDVMVGAGIGVAQLSTVGLVLLHRRVTPLKQSRVAWAVGTRVRRQRLVAGADPRIVMTGARPPSDVVPAGVSFSSYRVRLRDGDAVSEVEVWEVMFPFRDLMAQS
ncbi:hypothetical protein BBK14_27195 [Parafrankia soli]|uniref:Uncharacterized protein n=1 Tax=Parafrankia soli TaxID=2599596 RepID=A0A1S1PIC7_9ACTN|nr:hypothetical protein [Parafrankia soli]OHV21011.1 hypothetical protein BBK14_27195 [Parafrankia soli]